MRIVAFDGEWDRQQWRELVRVVPPFMNPDDPGLSMSEAQLQDAVESLAATLGYLAYHTRDSRKSAPGFPDLVLVNAARRRTLFVELKAMTGTVSLDQATWLHHLAAAGQHVYLYTPVDWLTGSIERELRGPRI